MEFKKANIEGEFKANVYHFGIDTQFPIIGNIELDNSLFFISVPEHENINNEKNRLIRLNEGYSPIALAHVGASDENKLKNLINQTAQKFIDGKYGEAYEGDGGDGMLSLIGYRRLVNGDALLVICDIGASYLEDELLLCDASAHSVATVLKNHGIIPKKVFDVDESSGSEFMEYLKDDTGTEYSPDMVKMEYETHGDYFYNLISQDIMQRPIIEQKSELDKNISEKTTASAKLKI